LILPYRCFPHIVNLSCKAVLSVFTRMDFASEDAALYEPPPGHLEASASFFDAIDRDPIASLRSAIRNVGHYFNSYFISINH
jgi:hypothetical protein